MLPGAGGPDCELDPRSLEDPTGAKGGHAREPAWPRSTLVRFRFVAGPHPGGAGVEAPERGRFYADRGHRGAPRAGAGPQDGHDDAMGIADLLACGLIKASFVSAQDIPERRSLMPTRKHPVREQTRPAQRRCISINGGCARSDAQPPPAGGRRGDAAISSLVGTLSTRLRRRARNDQPFLISRTHRSNTRRSRRRCCRGAWRRRRPWRNRPCRSRRAGRRPTGFCRRDRG